MVPPFFVTRTRNCLTYFVISMKDEQKHTEKVMSVPEVAAYLKIPASTIYELTRKGKIRSVKVGRQWRYLEADVLAFLRGESKSASHPNFPETGEKRKHSRIKTEISGTLDGLLLETSGIQMEGMIRNLSEGGALFASSVAANPLGAGDPVRIAFEIPSTSSQPTEVQGRIVHSRMNPKPLFGIKFKQISPETHEVIRGYVG